MNKNVLGGLAALIALAAIFYFSRPDVPPVAKPEPVAVHSVPIKPEPVKPAAKPEPVKPAAKPEPVKPEPQPKVIFYRVEHGGGRGPATECATVKPFADGKSTAELAILAKQYGVSESELKRYFVCTNE